MAKSGQMIENPKIGDRIVFRKTAGETDGELLEFDIFVQPAAAGPPEHVHPQSEETFKLLKGQLEARVDGEALKFGAGDRFTVSPGVPHTWWNSSDGEAHVRVQFSPAARMESFLETLYGLARDGKTDETGVPGLLQMAVIAPEYYEVNHLADPPLPVQKALFTVLRPIGRLLGYRSVYPYPYEGVGQAAESM